LIPLRLQVRREDRTELQDPAGRRVTRRNDESRTWEFVASR